MHIPLMPPYLALFLLAFAATPGPGRERGQDLESNDRVTRIHKILSAYHEHGQFDGAALVAIRGEVVYRRGFGLAHRDDQQPITPDTTFAIASLGKAFTAFLILQLVDEGRLDLEEPISSYLPTYRKDIGDQVSIHQLLTHTSGIPWWPNTTEVYYQTPYTLDRLVELANGLDLSFEPGTQVLYSNSAYNLLAAILKEQTGNTYAELLRERILEPAGMQATGCAWPAANLKLFTLGYDRLPGGEYVPAAYNDQSYAIGAGGLYSSVEDMFLWERFLKAEEHLSPAATKRMFTDWQQGNGYGWGIGSYEAYGGGGGTLASGNGGTIGFRTVHSRCLDDDYYVVLLSNVGQTDQGRIHNDVINTLLGFPVELPAADPAEGFYARLLAEGIDAVYIEYEDEGRRSELGLPDEAAIDAAGKIYLIHERFDAAVTLLGFNAEVFSTSWTAHASLGEAYMRVGRNGAALASYRRSLELNPRNAASKRALEALRKDD